MNASPEVFPSFLLFLFFLRHTNWTECSGRTFDARHLDPRGWCIMSMRCAKHTLKAFDAHGRHCVPRTERETSVCCVKEINWYGNTHFYSITSDPACVRCLSDSIKKKEKKMACGVYKHLRCLLLGLVKRNRNQTLMPFKKKYSFTV